MGTAFSAQEGHVEAAGCRWVLLWLQPRRVRELCGSVVLWLRGCVSGGVACECCVTVGLTASL